MEEIKTTIYECEFCRKYYKRKHFAIRHEKQCPKNPNNKHKCYNCTHLIVGRDDYSNYHTKRFVCRLTDNNMHTCKAEARGFADKLNSIRMPIECDMFLDNQPINEDLPFNY